MNRLPGAANGPRGAEQICLLGAIGASGAIRVLSRASIPRNPSQAVASCQMIALAPSNYIPTFSSFSSTVPLFLLPFHIIPPSFLLNMTDSRGRDQLLPRKTRGAEKCPGSTTIWAKVWQQEATKGKKILPPPFHFVKEGALELAGKAGWFDKDRGGWPEYWHRVSSGQACKSRFG